MQPGLAEPHEVPGRGRHASTSPASSTAVEVVFTAQEIIVGKSELPHREDRRRTPATIRQLGPGLREPRRAADGARAALRLRRRPGLGRRHHGAHDRPGLPDQRSDRRGHGTVRGVRAQPRRHDPRHHASTARRPTRSTPSSCPRACSAPRSSRGTRPSRWASGTATGTRRPRVLAPTGTIGLMMDCDTTGIEPDLALVKTKKLVGGGTMQIVNQTVPRALDKLGYDRRAGRRHRRLHRRAQLGGRARRT